MSTQENGGAIIAAALVRAGVRHLFTLCGGHISPILVECKRHGLKVVDMRDEGNAVFAADAVARMTGVPGVAAVTAGPGVTNCVTALKNAQMAQSPILLVGGATATLLKGRGSLQDIDQLSLMRPLTKWATRVTTLNNLGPTVERALEVARSGVPGPVFVEVPVDLLYTEVTVREWYVRETGVRNAKGLGARALGLYLEGHLLRQFHAPRVPAVIDVSAPSIHLPQLRKLRPRVNGVAARLARARRPVMVIGSQALVNCKDPDRIARAVRALGVPTFLGGMARGLLGRNDPLQFRHARGKALAEADLVIIAGFPFDFRLGYGRGIGRKAFLVAANLSGSELRKNRRPQVALRMHPGELIVELAAQAGDGGRGWTDWLGSLREREAARDAEIAREAKTPGELVNPLELFLRLEEKMADDAALVVDGGLHAAPARAARLARSRRLRHPRRRRRFCGRRGAGQAGARGVAHLRRRVIGVQPGRVRHLRTARARAHRGDRQRRFVAADRPRAGGAAGGRRRHGAPALRLPQGRRGLRWRRAPAHRRRPDRRDARPRQGPFTRRQAGLHQRAHPQERLPQGLHLDVTARPLVRRTR